MKKLITIFFSFFLIAAYGQSDVPTAQAAIAVFPWTTIDRNEYSLQCPAGWKIDSSANELKLRPREKSEDSLIIYVEAFKMKVFPFSTYIKNPPIDYDARTSISVNNNGKVYKVASTTRCYTCANTPVNNKREQYYCVSNNKVYVLFSSVSDKALKKYEHVMETILSSFKLKD